MPSKRRRPPWMKQAERHAAEKPKDPPTLWGIFKYDERGRYPAHKALKVYKRRSAAEKFCSIRPDYAARPINP